MDNRVENIRQDIFAEQPCAISKEVVRFLQIHGNKEHPASKRPVAFIPYRTKRRLRITRIHLQTAAIDVKRLQLRARILPHR
jgi:hypothetical protein